MNVCSPTFHVKHWPAQISEWAILACATYCSEAAASRRRIEHMFGFGPGVFAGGVHLGLFVFSGGGHSPCRVSATDGHLGEFVRLSRTC